MGWSRNRSLYWTRHERCGRLCRSAGVGRNGEAHDSLGSYERLVAMRNGSSKLTILILFAGMSLSPCLAGEASMGVLLLQTSDANGVQSYYRATPAQLDSSPQWNPEKEPLPLSIAHAVAKARQALDPPSEGATYLLNSIDLMAVQGHGDTRWYYAISFYARMRWPTPESMASEHVVILLDGTVIEPTQE